MEEDDNESNSSSSVDVAKTIAKVRKRRMLAEMRRERQEERKRQEEAEAEELAEELEIEKELQKQREEEMAIAAEHDRIREANMKATTLGQFDFDEDLEETPPPALLPRKRGLMPGTYGVPYHLSNTPPPWASDPFMGFPPVPSQGQKARPASAPTVPVAAAAVLPNDGSQNNKKKKQAKKPKKNPEEEEKKQQLIEAMLDHFSAEKKELITCQDEVDTRKESDNDTHSVAKWYTLFKGTANEQLLDLATFKSTQIRRLAKDCGVKRAGTMTLFDARKHIALSINMGTLYNDKLIANPHSSREEKKLQTWWRVANAVFHKKFVSRFCELNDNMKREHYEAAHGGNPIKSFWLEVSEFVNDTQNNPVLSIVLYSDPDVYKDGDLDERLYEWVTEEEPNLNDFSLQTYASCQQLMSDAMKAREECLK
ncbi:unknown protein [Seminavis robusta]|uniref:Uncharacterized protein n=1 Tax=Seminavis robusta TaxID=568900 RepID=A0A9N8ED51_9STRA|nr:unknown protein [Seminavis robusta]|eukprot:Sro903_g218280.1 n/a (425) ;mRNA; f:24261-25535